jgi:DNA adenine methylase
MIYIGSKRRIAKHILPIILKGRKPGQYYVEPFVGGGNIIDQVGGLRIGADCNEYAVAFLDAISKGWLPPETMNDDDYCDIRDNKEKYTGELVGYTGFALSFGGRFFSSFSKNNRGSDYVGAAFRSAQKQGPLLSGVKFIHSDYTTLTIPPESIVYCDPPYKNTKRNYISQIDHDEFWEWCRELSRIGHSVYISERTAPDDFRILWESTIKNNLTNGNDSNKREMIERLYTYE